MAMLYVRVIICIMRSVTALVTQVSHDLWMIKTSENPQKYLYSGIVFSVSEWKEIVTSLLMSYCTSVSTGVTTLPTVDSFNALRIK